MKNTQGKMNLTLNISREQNMINCLCSCHDILSQRTGKCLNCECKKIEAIT